MTASSVPSATARRWLVLLLAALAALAALLLPAAPASAAGNPAAEKGVGAVHSESILSVGVHECIAAGQHRVRAPSQRYLASGRCVAAEASTSAADEATGQFAYHYTSREVAESIARTGLKEGGFATPNGQLGPLQAQIELALPYRELPTAAVRIDLQGLQGAGYELPQVTRVASRYGMPGGGWEMQFPYEVPADFLKLYSNPLLP